MSLLHQWAEARIKTVVFAQTEAGLRQNLRFRGPTERLHSWRYAVDNCTSINVSELSEKLAPFTVYMRAPSGNDTISSLEIFVPKGGGFAFLLSALFFFVAGILFTIIAIYLQIRDINNN